MADNDISLRITAEDDASKVIDKVGESAEDLTKKPYEVEVETNADRVAGLLKQAAADITAEIKKTDEAAEALGRSLGPELAAKMGQGGLREAVGSLEKLGLTMEEITADADKLAGAIKEVADVPVDKLGKQFGGLQSSLGSTRQGLDDVGKAADSSKSVLANMIGNTTQDMGALAGVTGSAGVAIGQMGEYMADAVSSGQGFASVLKSFGGIAAPVAGLALAGVVMGEFAAMADRARQELEDLKKAQEALAAGDQARFVEYFVDQYGGLVTALDAAGISTTELLDALETGRVTEFEDALRAAGVAGYQLGGSSIDLGENLTELQRNWDANNRSAGRNNKATRLVAEAMGMVVTATGEIVSKQEALAQGVDGVIEALGGVVDETDDVTAATKKATKAAEDHLEMLEGTVEVLQGEKEALEDSIGAINDRISAQRRAADATLDVHEAEDQWLDTLDALPKKLDDVAKSEQSNEGRVRDTQEAYNDAALSAAAMADAAVAQAETVARASGATLTAAESMDTWNKRMLDAASNAGAGSPVEKAILDYIATVNKIEPEKVTEISAALAAGDIEEANRLLDEASQTRVASIEADANVEALNRTTLALDNLADAIRTATILTEADTTGATSDVEAWEDHFKRNPVPIAVTPQITGFGKVSGGLFSAGGAAPPAPGGLALMSAAAPVPVAAMASAVTHNYSINVQADTVNPADIGERIVEAIRQYERRSGRGWRS